MADKVQLSLEQTINELDQLVKQGLFTKTEIRNIIKKRRFYEYKFEKKDVTKQDFFKAIRYEKILDKKRKQRKKEKKIKQTSYFEYTFLRRAVYLFQKLIRKFSNSQEIWMEFFYFLIKNHCYNVINREVGKCLSLFPQNLEFWKIAAYNEHENNCNSLTARTLLQKCIRMNKDNVDAYLEYFVFELKFVEKLVLREKFLKVKCFFIKGDDDKKLKFVDDIEEDSKIEENKRNFEKIELSDQVLSLQIPEIIWKNALDHFKGIEKDIITVRFLEVLYKNSKVINVKTLKQKMKSFLEEEGVKRNDTCTIQTRLINASLQKYSKNDILNKFNHKYSKTLEKEINNHTSLHQIISNMLNFMKDQLISEYDEEEAKTVKFIIFQNIVKYLRKEELMGNPDSSSNLNILSFLIENYNDYSKILIDYKLNLKEIVQNIILLQLSNQSINVKYLTLLHNLMKLNNLNNLQIINQIHSFFQVKGLKAPLVIGLTEFSLGIVFEDINTLGTDSFINPLNNLQTMYKSSVNKSISTNRSFVELLSKNFMKTMLKTKEYNCTLQKVYEIIKKMSQEYLINYREILSKMIINKEELPKEFKIY